MIDEEKIKAMYEKSIARYVDLEQAHAYSREYREQVFAQVLQLAEILQIRPLDCFDKVQGALIRTNAGDL